MGHFGAKFQAVGDMPHQPFERLDRPVNALQVALYPLRVFAQNVYSTLSSKEVQFYSEYGHFAFLSPLLSPFGGLKAMYAVYLRLIGKRVVDLTWIVIIELFSAKCYG